MKVLALFKPFNYFIKYLFIGIKSVFLSFPIFLITKITKKENKIPNIIIAISLLTYLICVFSLTRWYVQNERTKKFSQSLINEINLINDDVTEYQDTNNPNITNNNNQELINDDNYINVNLDYYINQNKDTVGWIKINNTKINYPIVQTKNNEYYLEHDFYKHKSIAGWIFVDYRNDLTNLNNNTIIYGHNLINRTMFGDIPTFLNENWLKQPEKPYIKLSTKQHNSIWQIFSIYKTTPTTDYLQARFNSMELYSNFLNKITKRSTKNFNINLTTTDKILTLSTCDDTGKYRVVVHAKLIKIENKNY